MDTELAYMTVREARDKLRATVEELEAAGYTVWGWDDESLLIGTPDRQGEVKAWVSGSCVCSKCGAILARDRVDDIPTPRRSVDLVCFPECPS